MSSYLDSPMYQKMLAQTLAQGQPQSQYPIQGLGNTLAQLLQTYQMKKSYEAQDKKQQQGSQALADLLAPPKYETTAAGPTQNTPITKDPNAPVQSLDLGTPGFTAQTPDPKNAQIAQLLQSGIITPDSLGPQVMQALGMGAPKEPLKYGENDRGFVPDPNSPTGYKEVIGARPRANVAVAGDSRLANPDTGQVILGQAPKPADYNQPFLADGTPNKAYQNYEINKATAGRPSTSVNVSADKSFRTTLGEKTASALDASATGAKGALQTIDAANQVFSALDSPGGVSSGPGATAVQFINQITGGDPQKVQNTRGAIQGMARLALGARSALKGQGQISDYEGRLLQQASAGTIDSMTAGEIRIVAKTADRLARQQIKQNADLLTKTKKFAPDTADMLSIYDVPAPTPYGAQTSDGWGAPRIKGQ